MDIQKIFEKGLPVLAKEFSLKDFKLKKFQKDVIKKIVSTQENTLAIMPTGGGKSLIYWLTAIKLKGITIVISPLIALIEEQVSKLKSNGLNAWAIHSGINQKEQLNILKGFNRSAEEASFLFVSPERLATDGFFEYALRKISAHIKLIAIDEVHCISQWGFDFRPFYKRIPDFLNTLFGQNTPPVLGLTATLNRRDIKEITNDLGISTSNILKDTGLMRGEVDLSVIKFPNEDEKEEKLWDLLEIHKNEKILIYLYRKYKKRGIVDLCNKANEKGYQSIEFHGDHSANERAEKIEAYKRNEVQIMFATNAFGMGIDIPDIQVVIHFMLPESVEQYYQEIGRAARNISSAKAYLLYSDKSIKVRKEQFINQSFPSESEILQSFEKITNNEKGIKTLNYFEDEEIKKCFSLLLDAEAIKIIAKGFTDLKMISQAGTSQIQNLIDANCYGSLITTSKKANMNIPEIIEIIYHGVYNNSTELSKGFDKCLFIESESEKLNDETIDSINKSISEKKQYKHDNLDYFTYLLSNFTSSKDLHQEIGRYLGVEKHLLGKIYATEQGDQVRSKSEIIIANLLFKNNIDYKYEEKLFYAEGKCIEPDFTIKSGNKTIYWEHLGMLGLEDYDNRWLKKKRIYDEHFSNQLVTTHESANLTNEVLERIKNLD